MSEYATRVNPDVKSVLSRREVSHAWHSSYGKCALVGDVEEEEDF